MTGRHCGSTSATAGSRHCYCRHQLLAAVAGLAVVVISQPGPAGKAVAQEAEPPPATSSGQASTSARSAGETRLSADSGNPPDSTPAAEGETPSRGRRDPGPTDKERERAAGIGFVLLAGIVSSGILLIAGVLIWGRRMRRISRQRTDGTPLDPLWYLRGRPPANSSGGHTSSGVPEEGTPPAPGETAGND